ncbi:hypothetical protein EXIGLDRAFT_842974 [Exidia glandulosa HHB12029]|uniref:Uncharacterized protein n=1 Tax=Exidia glandulosa HHB12029 TaxID=1314781 RepID=A0A165CY80_EXIGL|nr:hypothetical protein EXIGLDRAFT_842974 [Exidia glandulosa HHB12029]
MSSARKSMPIDASRHGTVRLAVEAALSTYYVAVALWESTKQGAFYYAVHVLHYRGLIDFPHLRTVPPRTGIEALEIAIDLMRRRLPRAGYLPPIQQEMAPYVSASPFRTHMDSTLHMLFSVPQEHAAREISFQRFLAIAEYELERYRNDGIPLPLDWTLICTYFDHIHGFPIRRASELMDAGEINNPAFVLYT